MRTLHKLYKIVKVNLPSQENNFYICNEVEKLENMISTEERDKLMKHFTSQRPTTKINVEFYDVKSYNKDLTCNAWWLYDGEQRHLFIDKLIKITAPFYFLSLLKDRVVKVFSKKV